MVKLELLKYEGVSESIIRIIVSKGLIKEKISLTSPSVVTDKGFDEYYAMLAEVGLHHFNRSYGAVGFLEDRCTPSNAQYWLVIMKVKKFKFYSSMRGARPNS